MKQSKQIVNSSIENYEVSDARQRVVQRIDSPVSLADQYSALRVDRAEHCVGQQVADALAQQVQQVRHRHEHIVVCLEHKARIAAPHALPAESVQKAFSTC